MFEARKHFIKLLGINHYRSKKLRTFALITLRDIGHLVFGMLFCFF